MLGVGGPRPIALRLRRHRRDDVGAVTVVQLYQRLERDTRRSRGPTSVHPCEHRRRAPCAHARAGDRLGPRPGARPWSMGRAADLFPALPVRAGERLIAANVAKDPTRWPLCRTVIAPLSAAWRDSWSSCWPGRSERPGTWKSRRRWEVFLDALESWSSISSRIARAFR